MWVALVLLLGPPVARADSICSMLGREAKEEAVRRIREAGRVLWLAEGFREWTVSQVGVVRGRYGERIELRVAGRQQPIDVELDYLYLPADGGFRGLAFDLECAADLFPETLPARLFTDASEPGRAPPADSFLGFLDLRGLLPWPVPDADPILARAAPSEGGAVTLRLTGAEPLLTAAYGYERVGALVVERSADWYRVALQGGASAWIGPGDATDYHELASVLLESLTYLGDGWDGRLYAQPSLQAPARLLDGAWRRVLEQGGEISADVRETTVVDGRLWARLDVFRESPCQADMPAVAESGWVPVVASPDRGAVWFYSRGC